MVLHDDDLAVCLLGQVHEAGLVDGLDGEDVEDGNGDALLGQGLARLANAPLLGRRQEEGGRKWREKVAHNQGSNLAGRAGLVQRSG